MWCLSVTIYVFSGFHFAVLVQVMSLDQNSLDELLYLSAPRPQKDVEEIYYIFFITGNPGLIGYYEPFLSTLSSLLEDGKNRFCIFGASLEGFEISSARQDEKRRQHPVGLLGQIELTEARLRAFVRQHYHNDKRVPAKVILIGHSVGAYILLELIRRHHAYTTKNPGSTIEIIGGILLFPTVTHIAQSPSGIRFSVRSHTTQHG